MANKKSKKKGGSSRKQKGGFKEMNRGVPKGPGINTQSSFSNYQGMATAAYSYHFAIMRAHLDFETDIANIKSSWITPSLMNLINSQVIDKWNSTQLDNYADLVCYGAQLLAELKPQMVIKEYAPGITRTDTPSVGTGQCFTRATWEGLLDSLENIMIPPMSYTLVNFVDKVIQLQGAEFDAGQMGTYLYPIMHSKTYAQIETLLNTINTLYDAVVYATQSGQMLVPIDYNWLNTINEVSICSQFGATVANYMPCLYDNAGAETEYGDAITNTTDLEYSQILQMPEYMDALPLFRISSGNPYCYQVDPTSNDTLNIRYIATYDASSWTNVAKTDDGFDWIKSVATSRSVSQRGLFVYEADMAGSLVMVQYANPLTAAAEWDRRCASWLSAHSRDPTIPEITLPVLPDIITTVRRPTSGGMISTPASPTARQRQNAAISAAIAAGRSGARTSGHEQRVKGGAYYGVD